MIGAFRAAALLAALAASSCLLLSPLDRRAAQGETDTPSGAGGTSGQRALESAECPLVLGDDPSNPDAIVFGGYATLGTDADEEAAVVLNYRLALEELNAGGGLPDPPGGTRHHPLVMVVCDNSPDRLADTAFFDRSLDHLISRLHVPALIAYLLPDQLKYAFETYGHPQQTFFLSPIGATQALDAEPDDNLLWHMLGQPSDLAPGYLALSRLLQAYVEKTIAISSVKVAAVTSTAAFDSELAGSVIGSSGLLETNPVFNGKSLSQNALDRTYRRFTIDPGDPSQSESAVGSSIAAFQPNIVISLTDTRFTRGPGGVLPTVETMWSAGAPRPFYILSPINAGSLPDVQMIISDMQEELHPDAYRRFIGIGVAGARDTTLYNAYLSRLFRRFQTGTTDTENFYDAMYFLAYATYAAMRSSGIGQPVAGSAIAAGMREIISGPVVYPVGPDDVFSVLHGLAGGPIRLLGTLGPPDFDPFGARIDTASVFCFDAAGAARSQVLRYDASTGAFVGTFSCFPGFF